MATFASSKAKYKIQKKIGKGGEGDAFLALMGQDDQSVQTVVVKLLRRRDTTESKIFERLATIIPSSPYVIGMIDHFQTGYGEVVVLEYVRGRSLLEFMMKRPFEVTENWKGYMGIIRQIAEGIKFLHDNDIIHRDLKPENIMITDTHTIKIIDMGFACVTDEEDVNDLTCKNRSMGTITHMPPEVISKEERSLRSYKKADIYAFGVIIYELLSDDQAFVNVTPNASTAEIVLHKLNNLQLTDAFPELHIISMINAKMARLIRSMIEHNYRERPNIDQVIQALNEM